MKIDQLYSLYKEYYLVDTDTRTLRENSIYFALKGDSFDGNLFAIDAINQGARYAVVDDPNLSGLDNIIVVDDVLSILQKLSNYHRIQLNTTFIALTGSNGKTTTKELLNAVLSKKYKVKATKGNLNNHIGVPITLLSITPDIEYAIIEMGANHIGEISFLTRLIDPDYGYITNFGKAHLEGFGSLEGVIKGKTELYDYAREFNKTIFVNPTDELQCKLSNGIKREFINDTIQLIEVSPFVKVSFRNNSICSGLIGSYNYTNIIVAMSIGMCFDIPFFLIKQAIESYIPNNNRSQVFELGSNKFILDAYNANPSSMKVALENFKNLSFQNKIVVLGDMLELGDYAHMEHQNLVDYLVECGFKQVFLVGANFVKTNSNFSKFNEFDDLAQHLLTHSKIENATILIKGSRGLKLERVLNIYQEWS